VNSDAPQDKSTILVVDRREGHVVVLVDDSGKAVEVDAATLPADCRSEGAVLRVPLDSGSQPAWASAIRDRTEEKRRLQINAARLSKLRRGDPGGDVSL
jgi:hypothetical protein